MSNELPQIEQSLCWKCQYGICIQENDSQKIAHPNFVDLSDSDDPFGDHDESQEAPTIMEHVIKQEHIRSVCFWKPEGITNNAPVVFAFVDKCNRFKQKS